MGRIYDMPIIPSGGTVAPRPWLNGVALGMIGEPYLASTACAVLFISVCMGHIGMMVSLAFVQCRLAARAWVV